MKTLGTAMLVVGAAMAGAQNWVREPARPGVEARDAGLLREVMVAGHNRERAGAGLAPLTWDERLARDAADYARVLARTDRFQHSAPRGGGEDQGENLWAGTRGSYAYTEMVGHWLAERRDFRPGVVPNVSRTGNFGDVAHYANIIWPTTRAFGCALAANPRTEYLVCRYAPPGNVYGQRVG